MPNEWVIPQNIRRYRELLQIEPEGDKRRTLEKLLAEQEARLPANKRGRDLDDERIDVNQRR
jgi:hypothetical protein